MNNFLKGTFVRSALLFSALLISLFPFPYQLLPNPESWLRILFIRIGLDFYVSCLPIASDSPVLVGLVVCILLLALLAGTFWQWRLPNKLTPQLAARIATSLASYYLALHLLIYGFNKVFKHQFYLPEPNILYTPMGQLNPDMLYWSVIGLSRSYSIFLGLLEVIPALLLFIPRTRQLGAMAAAAVLFHVFVLNLSYDISVKLHSGLLLLLAIGISLPAWQTLFRVLVLRHAVLRSVPSIRIPPKFRLAYALGKATVITLLFAESLVIYARSGNFNDDQAMRPAWHGAYQTEWMSHNGDTVQSSAGDSTYIQQFFVHRNGYLILRSTSDHFTDYRITSSPNDPQLTLLRAGKTYHAHLSNNKLQVYLSGIFEGDTIQLAAKPLDWRKLPAMRQKRELFN